MTPRFPRLTAQFGPLTSFSGYTAFMLVRDS